jgi:hypothetical protein
MAKKSKLTEKPTRFSSSFEIDLNESFQTYTNLIVQQNNEAAKALAFSHLLKDWFSKANPTFLEDYLKGVEKSVRGKQNSLVLRGEIDALFGNAIIEFESDLKVKAKLHEAKKQLQRYAYLLITEGKEIDRNYLCIATDGILFYVFAPSWKNADKAPSSSGEIELRQIEKTDFITLNGENAFLWLDRYFFRQTPLHPTTENFVHDFGMNSPAYIFATKLLQTEWQRVHKDNEFKVIFENWAKYLSIAYGTTVADRELFFRHTYLASFAKLLAYMRLANKAVVPSSSEIADIFTGKFFKQLGIDNFLEEDFFAWIARDKVQKTLVALTLRVSTLLEKYHLDEISEDVLKSLYQELVDPETRHDLGEFYTPDWLADRVVRHALKENAEASVLDPSCGSGSFLYFAIRYKRERLGDSKEILNHIRDTVVGIDIHPLAVIISKTNYLLALGEIVRKRVKDFHIPIYMANSLMIPERSSQMTTEEKVPSLSINLDNAFVPFPEVFIEHPAVFDEAVETCHSFAKEQRDRDFSSEHFQQFARRRLTEISVDDVTLGVLFSVAKRMRELIEKERNSIWTFILKNVYKPIFLRKQFDWILGNPPWLSFRYVEKGEYQEFLRRAILKTYGLLGTGKGHLITHLELGTLFFVASLTEYGKKSARIGFVLPRSIFTADQHENFRKASFGKAIHGTGLTEVWDAENVSPLFNVPACIIFGKNRHFTEKPISAEVLGGTLDRRNASLEEAKKHLLTRDTKLHIIQQGDRSFWSENPKAEIVGSSPYASNFSQGATIVPRTAWFVRVQSDEQLGFNPATPHVKTDERATEQAKKAYEDLFVEGNIEKEFLYATLLSTDLLPFGFLDYRPVVLPIKPRKERTADTFIMLSAQVAAEDGYTYLAAWLEYCEKEWKKRRREKAANMNIYQRLDHVHGLTRQHYRAKYKVVYPASATNLCSAVVPNEKITLNLGGQKIMLQNFIAESKLYYYETEDENEAHYLSALLNAPYVDQKIKPMQSKGSWGPRDIHKKVWELPIPGYDENKSAHNELAKLGIECTKKVTQLLPTLDTKEITPGKIGRLRNDVREKLSDELKEIDVIVRKIMVK